MSVLRFRQMSVRNRFIVSIIAMLLPIVVLGAVFVVAHREVVASLDNVVEETKEEMYPLLKLQLLLFKTIIPPHDYLLSGDSAEKDDFVRLAQKVDNAFEHALMAPFSLTEEHELMSAAHGEWQTGKKMGMKLLDLPIEANQAEMLDLMKLFDMHIERSVDMLTRCHDVVLGEVDELLALVQMAEKRLYFFMGISFVVGFGITLLVSIQLPRSVLRPLGLIENAAGQLANGNLAARVSLDRGDELGNMARAFNDMASKLESHHRALEELAALDSVTEVYNQRAFSRRLSEEIRRSIRRGHVFSLLAIRVDNLRDINNSHGKLVGEKALRAVASFIKSRISPEALTGRRWDDEFLVLFPGIPLSKSLKWAETMRGDIEALSLSIGVGENIHLAVTDGAAEFPADGQSEEELIAVAERFSESDTLSDTAGL